VKVGYVVKRHPRYSETFIVNEILAHEAAGMELGIFSVLPPKDSHFQDIISRVRAPVTYLPSKGLKVADYRHLHEPKPGRHEQRVRER
jgi:colanic acid/amylovoran biosynthesis glycosyltransferase